MPQDEVFSWLKLLKGPFVGKNYAKAIVLTFCQLILVVLLGSVFLTSKNMFWKNRGTVTQTDSHDQHKTWSLFNLIKIG